MVQLYLDEYVKNLIGRTVCIACREGILRDHFNEIVADIKFLVRKDIGTTFFHNLPHRVANQKLLRKLEMRLPATNLIRIAPELDFYQAVLGHPDTIYKLIFLERRYLIDNNGNKINALTTGRVREASADFGDLIANVNFRATMNRLCEKIEAGHCERIHILPAGKNTIKYELFTVEGTGTMIADNFIEEFRQVQTDEDVAIVHRILSMYKRSGFLKPRNKDYLSRNRQRFFVTAIDGIVVGCMEQKVIDERTVELGAVAISTRFRNQRVGVYTVDAFMRTMAEQGYSRFISLTKNPRLQALYLQLGFVEESPPEYSQRQSESPDVKMFYQAVDSHDFSDFVT
ncbi:MAG: GNAT family N-acetyltransferase [Desulforhopalus sp.]|nr:GNAT family N-acetyltransferase [Desulforhopalus sp.]